MSNGLIKQSRDAMEFSGSGYLQWDAVDLIDAAAARIRADAEAVKAADVLAEAADMCLPATDEPMSKDQAIRLATALTAFRRTQKVRAALGEKTDDE